MNPFFLLLLDSALFWVPVGIVVLYISFRTFIGFYRFRGHWQRLEMEGVLRCRKWVFIRVRFPLIHRITFAHIYLSKRRMMLFHFFTRGLILQVPLGPPGEAGTDKGYVEVEGSLLKFKSPIRGGGHIRMHVKNPTAWYREIKDNGY